MSHTYNKTLIHIISPITLTHCILPMTPAINLAKKLKLNYQIHEYEHDPNHPSFGLEAAEKMGVEPARVFKTLVGQGNVTGPVVFCIPVAAELDLKQAARVSGNKSVALVHVKDLLGLTGYMRGGCSPVGMKKLFPTYFDATMEGFDEVYVSAGLRGLQIKVNPKELADVVEAKFDPLTQK